MIDDIDDADDVDVDVVVAGAGLAGLVTATELVASGLSVRVLEASDRIGGRTLSRRLGGAAFDFGGQWILPTQQRMLALTAKLGIELTPQRRDGHTVTVRNGARKVDAGLLAKLPPLHAIELAYRVWQLERLQTRTGRVADVSLADWIDTNVRATKAREALAMLAQLTFAVEPAELSLRSFLEATAATGGLLGRDEFEDGVVAMRCVGGAQQICERLAAALPEQVVLNCEITGVDRLGESVAVHTAAGTHNARRAVLAMPPPAVSRLSIEPGLDQLADTLLLGPIIKCVATYDARFWTDDGFAGEAYSTDGTVRAVVDVSAEGVQPALMAFIVGETAREWSRRTADERRAQVLDELAAFFGEHARTPTEFSEMDWLAAPHSQGCVGVFGVGGDADDWAQARQPAGHLYFASADTAADWPGHMEGAVEAGERTAARVLSSLD